MITASKTAVAEIKASGTASTTLATAVYDQLRVDILAGRLCPDSKLGIEFLCGRYDTGQIPIREALNRLSSDGLVDRLDQKGFRVAPISTQDLEELTKTRCWLEGMALAESIERRTKAWDESVVLAHYRMTRTPRSLSKTSYRENPDWEPLHRAFHLALLSNCGSRWMLDFCAQLADHSYRYRQISIQRVYPVSESRDTHAPIMKAALEGDAAKAVALLQSHLRFTAETILRQGGLLLEVADHAGGRRKSAEKTAAIAKPRKRVRPKPD